MHPFRSSWLHDVHKVKGSVYGLVPEGLTGVAMYRFDTKGDEAQNLNLKSRCQHAALK